MTRREAFALVIQSGDSAERVYDDRGIEGCFEQGSESQVQHGLLRYGDLRRGDDVAVQI